MCGSTVDIQSAIAEIRRGKKKRKKIERTTGQNIMCASAMQGSHINNSWRYSSEMWRPGRMTSANPILRVMATFFISRTSVSAAQSTLSCIAFSFNRIPANIHVNIKLMRTDVCKIMYVHLHWLYCLPTASLKSKLVLHFWCLLTHPGCPGKRSR